MLWGKANGVVESNVRIYRILVPAALEPMITFHRFLLLQSSYFSESKSLQDVSNGAKDEQHQGALPWRNGLG